jgi:YD repeat-containing protein
LGRFWGALQGEHFRESRHLAYLFDQCGLNVIPPRYAPGAFGRGRVAPWELFVFITPEGEVQVFSGLTLARRFWLENGRYVGGPGEKATLVKSNSWHLIEPTGFQTVFHEGGRLDYEYDARGQVTVWQDARGNQTTFNYTPQGQLAGSSAKTSATSSPATFMGWAWWPLCPSGV